MSTALGARTLLVNPPLEGHRKPATHPHPVLRVLHSGHPGETPAALDRTIAYAIDLDPDFANFYPAVPCPGTAMHAKARRDGSLASEDWSRMEYSHYLFRGNGLTEREVLDAVNRGRRRFYPRPAAIVRHFGDMIRLVWTDWRGAWRTAARILFGGHDPAASPPPPSADRHAA